jgi:hypothetical protein
VTVDRDRDHKQESCGELDNYMCPLLSITIFQNKAPTLPSKRTYAEYMATESGDFL